MIQKVFFTLALFFSFVFVQAQQDYMDKIAEEVCECIADKKNDNTELFKMELGVCVIQATKNYHTELKRDYGVDASNLNGPESEKLGEIIGVHLINFCPETLLAIGKMVEEAETYEETFNLVGTIEKVHEGQFIVFDVRNENNRIEKLYWLLYIDSEFDIVNNYKDLVGKKVRVNVFLNELFDARILEYRMCNIINTLEVID